MTKKIIGICMSPRKNSETAKLLTEALRGAAFEGAEVELIKIDDKKISPCTACSYCSKYSSCYKEDDLKLILDKMNEADGIIIGSPVYFYDVTAQCKMLIDRSISIQPINGNKVGGIITVAGSLGHSEAIKTLNMFYSVQGITSAGFVSSYGEVDDKPRAKASAFELGIKMVKMSNVLKNSEAFTMHNHYAFGTHTK
ncbi:flavodoxin family protein [Acidaminobacter sp. JC074]|uniref:flavodoxin family protein n=1 Tax=Acidaminobacter sp. JC074 TaxID=2530199 RepID=UPI001F0D2003|nr:flavodoxin family protein [Acidaminobacter sp. JC074]MCH4889217.1 flavodoxin family protein [Acidaminobacter sp. JC074]